MLFSLKKFLSLLKPYGSAKDRELARYIHNISGVRPLNLNLYKLAISHSSSLPLKNNSGISLNHSYERLEYLGDAVLGTIVAEYLFKKFPFKDEGFLTEIRSRIVNREALNHVSRKIGLSKIVLHSGKGHNSHKSVYGDALEALVGAIYLDYGFHVCKSFVLHKIVTPHFDMEDVVNNNKNFKSILIEWGQKENKKIIFRIVKETGNTHNREFTAEVVIENESVSEGSGHSKKKAEQAAAEKACIHLKVSQD